MCWDRASSSVGRCGSHPYKAAHLPRNPNASEPPINPNPMMAILDSARLKSGCDMLRHETTINRFSHCFDLLHHFGKGFRCERLLAIGDRMRGILMYFNDDAIGTRSDTRLCDRRDITRIAGGMTRINDDWQMRKFFEDRNGIDIGGVARGSFKGADTALA